MLVTRTSEGPFSAVLKPNFATEGLFWSIFGDLLLSTGLTRSRIAPNSQHLQFFRRMIWRIICEIVGFVNFGEIKIGNSSSNLKKEICRICGTSQIIDVHFADNFKNIREKEASFVKIGGYKR